MCGPVPYHHPRSEFPVFATRFRTSRARRLGTLAAVSGVLLTVAGPAFAHVTVSPTTAAQGSTVELTFKVPNEESKANTVEVQIQIPTDHPIAQALARPVPGWTISEKIITLAKPLVTDDGTFTQAVSEITWSGGSIAPGQYQDFAVSADPLPKYTTQLVFKAVQTYSNGDVIRWIDLTQAGQPAPDHPAPVLTLTAASDTSTAATTTTVASVSSSSSDGTARALAIAGLAVAVVSLVGVGLLLARTRRGSTS
jgi:uncharacterized protein YcnI